MRDLKVEIPRVAASPVPRRDRGGVGHRRKELIARAIHEEGPRGRAVFVPVNCAVLDDELFGSELFRHVRGAFTGAAQDRKGLIEVSSGGTVFLDEVAELRPRAQAKLLRVLQDGEIRRLGENRTQRLDLRAVAATNPAAGGRSGGRPLPQGSALPPQRAGAHGPAAARARAGCRPARRPLLEGRGRRGRQPRDAGARDGRRPWGRTRGRATSASCRTCSPT